MAGMAEQKCLVEPEHAPISPSVNDPRPEVNLSAGYEFEHTWRTEASDLAPASVHSYRSRRGSGAQSGIFRHQKDQIQVITGRGADGKKSFYTQPFKSGIASRTDMQNVGVDVRRTVHAEGRLRPSQICSSSLIIPAYATVETATTSPRAPQVWKMKDIPDMLGTPDKPPGCGTPVRRCLPQRKHPGLVAL